MDILMDRKLYGSLKEQQTAVDYTENWTYRERKLYGSLDEQQTAVDNIQEWTS